MTGARTRLTIFIASPLEPEHVDRIRSVAPNEVEVIYEPDLLPATRYNADHKGRVDFSRTREQEERWQMLLQRAQVLWDFPPVPPDGKNVLDLVPNLKWVQTTSSGVGQLIKLLGVHDSDLLVTTARGVHAGPLSEFVFLALLSHVRRLPHLQAEQRRHRWERFCGDELAGKTLAIIGAGEVGRRVAAVGVCFGMRVVALARAGSDRTAEQLGVDVLFPRERLHDMLAQTDALVLSVPHTAETEGMIDKAALAALKPGGVLVNIARGQVVDQEAMIEALRVEGGFTPLLGYWIMCDDCVAEVAAQVMEVLQRRRLSGGVHHVVLNKDMEPVAILDSGELKDLKSGAPEGMKHGAAIHPIRQ